VAAELLEQGDAKRPHCRLWTVAGRAVAGGAAYEVRHQTLSSCWPSTVSKLERGLIGIESLFDH